MTTLQVGDFVGVEILTSNFDGASTVGFNWLGEPLAVSGSPLAANGAASMSAGHQVAVDAFNGLAGVYGVEPHSYDQIVALSK